MVHQIQKTDSLAKFTCDWYQDRIVYSNGKRTEEFFSKDPNIGLVLDNLERGSLDKHTPYMTEEEHVENLNYNTYADYQNKDFPVTIEAIYQYQKRVEPYMNENSEGGTNVTVDEMMKIADKLKEDYSKPKKWYKFW